MKKLIYGLTGGAVLIAALVSLNLNATSADDNVTAPTNEVVETTVPDNYTIQIYAELFADYTEEEVNDFFAYSDDDTIIIADETGGYFSNIDKSDTGYTDELDENMNVIARRYFNDKTQAATITEVKEYLNSVRQ